MAPIVAVEPSEDSTNCCLKHFIHSVHRGTVLFGKSILFVRPRRSERLQHLIYSPKLGGVAGDEMPVVQTSDQGGDNEGGEGVQEKYGGR